MRTSARAAFMISIVGTLVASGAVEAKKPDRTGGDRVEICHDQDNGRFRFKSLPPRAAAAHLRNHDDGVPGGVVPGVLGFKFDATCGRVPFATVDVGGVERFGDADLVRAALDEFAAATGIPITYTGLRDFQAVVDETIDTGAPPVIDDPAAGGLIDLEILIAPEPNTVAAIVASGAAVPAAPATEATVAAGWPQDWIDYGTVDGTLYAVPNKSDLKSLVWYKPDTFKDPGGTPYSVPTTFAELQALTDTIIANGQVPWCVGIQSGPATGWVFTDWVEDRLLGSEATSLYDDWNVDDVGFDDPRIRAAWNDVLGIWNTPGAVFEGIGEPSPGVGIVETSFFDSVFDLVAVDECMMHRQASFLPSIIPPEVLDTLATFPFPGDDPANSAVLGSGLFAVSLNADLEVALVHEYLGSSSYADARHAAQPAGFLSAVQGQDLSSLGALEVAFTETLQGADTFRFDASDLMPPGIGAGDGDGSFWVEGTNAVVGPGNSVDLGFRVYNGTDVDTATEAIADLFCIVAPGAACP